MRQTGGTVRYFHGYRPLEFMRNAICQDFLDSDCDRLWFLDADMVPPANAGTILDCNSDIVAGTVIGYKQDKTNGGILLQILAWTDDPWRSVKPSDRPMDVAAAGTGSMVIHRRVLEDPHILLEPTAADAPAPAIFRRRFLPWGAVDMTADLDFCERARGLGYRITLWPGIYGQLETLNLLDVSLHAARLARGNHKDSES